MITHPGIDETMWTFQGELVEAEMTKIAKFLWKQWQAGNEGANSGVLGYNDIYTYV